MNRVMLITVMLFACISSAFGADNGTMKK